MDGDCAALDVPNPTDLPRKLGGLRRGSTLRCDTADLDSADHLGGAELEAKSFLYHWWQGGEPAVGATHFGVTAQVLIGEVGDDRADSFDLILCSPSMFSEQYAVQRWGEGFAENVLPGGDVLPVVGVWLMRRWSPVAFEAAVHRLVAAHSPGPDFATLADRISRVMPWEYEYVFDNRVNREAGLPDLTKSFWHDDEIGSLS